MAPSSTPSLDQWQDLHAQASKAEHDLLMGALAYLSVGSVAPTRDEAERAKHLRKQSCAQFDAAVDELFVLMERTTLRSWIK
jgi:hypothetical protein